MILLQRRVSFSCFSMFAKLMVPLHGLGSLHCSIFREKALIHHVNGLLSPANSFWPVPRSQYIYVMLADCVPWYDLRFWIKDVRVNECKWLLAKTWQEAISVYMCFRMNVMIVISEPMMDNYLTTTYHFSGVWNLNVLAMFGCRSILTWLMGIQRLMCHHLFARHVWFGRKYTCDISSAEILGITT